MSNRFEGKVAVITGVSDRGIGGAIAERLAEEGAAIVALFHEYPKRCIDRLRRKRSPVLAFECDVRHESCVRDAIDACMAEFGQIDVLVNNAGVEVVRPFEELSDDDWTEMLDVNLTGAMRVTRAAVRYLTEPDGVIVSIASALGLTGCAGFPAYSATKAGLIGMTQSLAVELAPRRIRAVCVAPALVHTPMIHRHTASLTPEEQDRIEKAHPLGIGSPHDVASAVAFLASHEARWITGVALPLGWLNTFPMAGETSFMQTQQTVPLPNGARSTPVERRAAKPTSANRLEADEVERPDPVSVD